MSFWSALKGLARYWPSVERPDIWNFAQAPNIESPVIINNASPQQAAGLLSDFDDVDDSLEEYIGHLGSQIGDTGTLEIEEYIGPIQLSLYTATNDDTSSDWMAGGRINGETLYVLPQFEASTLSMIDPTRTPECPITTEDNLEPAISHTAATDDYIYSIE